MPDPYWGGRRCPSTPCTYDGEPTLSICVDGGRDRSGGALPDPLEGPSSGGWRSVGASTTVGLNEN